jgi:molybdenum cofactor cytidylyltransferase
VNLCAALGFDTAPVLPRVAFVGSGGKSTALFQLANQLLDHSYSQVWITTTTHFAELEIRQADQVIQVMHDQILSEELIDAGKRVILFCGENDPGQRVRGLNSEQINTLHSFADCARIPLLIEADGSRRKPLKAPADHEPVIPDFVNTVIVVVGLSGIGQRLSENIVHRVEIFSNITGIPHGSEITPQAVADVLTHREGGLKGIPEGARTAALLNQADAMHSQDMAHTLARLIVDRYKQVLIASLLRTVELIAVYKPIAGIILAAGSASRFHGPKQLLEWHGEPLVQTVVRTAINSGLSPVYVIIGAYEEEMRETLSKMPEFYRGEMIIVHNPGWSKGQSTSIRSGLDALKPDIDGVVFLLADQPLIPVRLVQHLQDVRAKRRSWIVAPRFQGRRANPVLFGRELFSALREIQGDQGGRVLLEDPSSYPVEWVDWDDPGLIVDIDSVDDLNSLQNGRAV